MWQSAWLTGTVKRARNQAQCLEGGKGVHSRTRGHPASVGTVSQWLGKRMGGSTAEPESICPSVPLSQLGFPPLVFL